MRLLVVDDRTRFSCGSCTACCDQPWHTLIEPDKAQALTRHDFSSYPQLAGKSFSRPSKEHPRYHELAKGEGTRCLFLDTDGLCIIHKELGPDAKPHMCRQFPFLPAFTAADDRVSVNFGCPSVQASRGAPLTDQREEITATVGVSSRPVRGNAETALDAACRLDSDEAEALFARLINLFDPAAPDDIWSRFSDALALVGAVRLAKTADASPDPDWLATLKAGRPLSTTPQLPSIHHYGKPSQAPMPARFLFAATMYPDAVPADTMAGAGFFKRLTLVPKLMALAKLTGAYSSRLLDRNVALDAVLTRELTPALAPAATTLLARYYQSRLWQRFIAGTRLSVTAGLHQHILDLNAILFFARAEAARTGAFTLDEPLIRAALTRVEFHLANQSRLHDHVLKNWLRAQLDSLDLAFQSLRLMALTPPPAQTDSVDPAAKPAEQR